MVAELGRLNCSLSELHLVATLQPLGSGFFQLQNFIRCRRGSGFLLINQGTDQIKDALGNVLGGNSGDTQTNNTVKDVLGGLLGGDKPKKTDSTSTETKNPVKDILGGFLGGKKKD